MFKFGYAATIFSGVWSTWYYEQNNKLDFGTTTIPQIFDKPATWGDSHTFILPKQPSKERQVAAAKFADWMTDHGTEWAVAGHIPSKKSVLRSNAYRKLKHRPSYAKVITSVNYFPQKQ